MLFNSIIELTKYSSFDIIKWKKTNIVSLYINIKNNVATYEHIMHTYTNHTILERYVAIKNMINDTLQLYKINDVELLCNLMDNPIDNPYFLHFNYTSNCIVNTIPNFSFYNWSDAKSNDFFVTKKNILNNNIVWNNKEDKIMWSGIASSNIRKKLNELKDDTLYFYNLINSYTTNHTYVALEDHTKYKYLLDMEGVGYSGRFPYLALTGSCIIILENEDKSKDYKMYYDKFFIENIHYLKVLYTNSETSYEINKKIKDSISKNDCKKIGEECQNLSITFFTKDNILLYMSEILNYYSTLYDKTSNVDLQLNYLSNKKNITKHKLLHLLHK